MGISLIPIEGLFLTLHILSLGALFWGLLQGRPWGTLLLGAPFPKNSLTWASFLGLFVAKGLGRLAHILFSSWPHCPRGEQCFSSFSPRFWGFTPLFWPRMAFLKPLFSPRREKISCWAPGNKPLERSPRRPFGNFGAPLVGNLATNDTARNIKRPHRRYAC